GQRSGDRPTYVIVQADGLRQLEACQTGGNRGDAGDPWPGSTNATEFGFETIPAAKWYTENSWTGLTIRDVVSDGSGSVQLTINWIPTTVPGMRFDTPPGGTSVGSNYDVQFTATDVYGGTTVRVYWIPDERTCSGNGAACAKNSDCPSGQVCRHDVTRTNLVGQMRKTTSGRNKLSLDWNIATVPDGRYVLFGALEPGPGADGTERSFTTPRGGRNNVGDGSLTVTRVNIAATARLETWTAVLSPDGTSWRVNSTISQPILNEADPEMDPYPRAIAGQPYISIRDEVRFTITQGATPFTAGDTLSFTTTGVTAVSSAVTIASGHISEDPVARIVASPLSGDPPLAVSFDGLDSTDPNEPDDLLYEWAFGDGSTATGAVVGHTYVSAGTFTAVLTVTNVNNGRVGAAAVDIVVTNNSPQAVLSAVPSSGPTGCSSDCALTVQFSGAESGDRETPLDQLIYRWDFGDGKTANDARVPGLAFVSQSHTYRNRADGTACTSQNPCELSATLTVIDADGKQDTATTGILVGNSLPLASVVAGPLQGPAPLTVRFNALNSIDADDDALIVDWDWGDGSKSLNVPVSGGGAGADGTVEHEYADAGEYTPTAIVRDRLTLSTPGVATAAWPGVKIVVLEGGTGGTNLRAIIRTNPTTIVVNEPFAADGLSSIGDISSYGWSWGDGTSGDSGVTATHTYTNTGAFQITLIVTNAGGETNSTSRTVVVVAAGEGEGEPDEENGRPIASLVVDPPTAEALVNEAFTVDARGSSDPDGDALRFLWTFGDGSPPVEGGVEVALLSHAYNTTGQFLVRLTVRDTSNAQASISQAVRVLAIGENRRPVPIIATGPRTASAPATLTFDGNASYDPDGDPIQFSWRFDLGTETITQTGAVVSQRFDSPGTFSVVLIVRDSEDAESESDPETILITPRVELPPPPAPDPIDDAAGQDIPDSAQQRPEGICGFGMIPAWFGSMFGLSSMWLARRRRCR
ncbi:MAG: PKD domain-containing protein, partial [Planctomycetes bacterium]|nr:PKD domain-containing protein [Planctomycetota bacterium]